MDQLHDFLRRRRQTAEPHEDFEKIEQELWGEGVVLALTKHSNCTKPLGRQFIVVQLFP
jgi:hypothetical protein